MNYQRHIDYYIPVLKVLEDLKTHEVNSLIEDTAKWCNLSDEQKSVKTRKGTQLKYESNIHWAIQDLCQGGFIDRTERGIYTIAYDGLLMLEDNPTNPDRNYLEARSDKFSDFRHRRRKTVDEEKSESVLFPEFKDETPEPEDINNNPLPKISDEKLVSDAEVLLKKYESLREMMLDIGTYDTSKEDRMIAMLKEGIIKNTVLSKVKSFIDSLQPNVVAGKALIIDFLNSNGSIYLSSNSAALADLCASSISVYDVNPSKTEKDDTTNESPTNDVKFKKLNKVTNKNPPQKLKVTFEDGSVIDGKYAADVFAKTIEKIGAKRVMDLKLSIAGIPLVGKTPPEKYNFKVISGGYYIPVNISSERKKIYLERIAKVLDINLNVLIL